MSTPNAPSTPTHHHLLSHQRQQRNLHGLRAIAIIFLLLFHATGELILPGGFIGIDLFFVISGFLITDMFLRMDSPTGWPRVAQLIAHRCRALLPLGALVLLITTATTVIVYPPTQWANHGMEILNSALFVLNWLFSSQPPGILPELGETADILTQPLLHYWVIAVDTQFLLLWAVILTVVIYFSRPHSTRARGRSRFRIRPDMVSRNTAGAAVIFTGVFFTWAVVAGFSAVGPTPEQAFFSTPIRLWELGLGAMIAAFSPQLGRLPQWAGHLASVLGLSGLVIAGFFYDHSQFHPGYTALLPAGATAAIIIGMLSNPGRGIDMVFNSTIVQWLGRLALPLYLWHWPVLVIGGYLLGATPSMGTGLILVLVSFIPAWLSYRLIARPLSSWSPIRYSTTNALSMGFILILLCFLCGVLLLIAARF